MLILGIYQSITKSILDENTISDDASKTLSTLRRTRRRFESDIKEKLNSFIHSSTYSKYIMEPIITIRNDRYVIPVKIEYILDNETGKDHNKRFYSSVYFEGEKIGEGGGKTKKASEQEAARKALKKFEVKN